MPTNNPIKSSTSLGDALFTKTQQQVLGLLFGNPDRSFYSNEIVRYASIGIGTVQRELKRLVAAGLLTVTPSGNQKHYQANRLAPVFDELRSIVIKTFGIADVLKTALMPLFDRIDVAFIFGSVAKKSDKANSDIDVMIIGQGISYSELMDILGETESRLGRPVNPTLYTQTELNRKLNDGNAFLLRVMNQPKIFLKGSEDDITQS